MFSGELKVGDRLIWRHTNPSAFAPLAVEAVETLATEKFIRSTDGQDWHCMMPQSELRRHCMRHPYDKGWGYVDIRYLSIRQMETEWHAQMKTAAQHSQAAAENPNREPTGQDASIIHPL